VKDNNKLLANEEITVPQIRLIDKDGNMLGVVTPARGMAIAAEDGLDLVVISPGAEPPVCKIMDLGKHKYELQKKAHKAKKNQRVVEIKEIKVRPNIAEGDFEVKLRKVQEFLQDGNKVRISLQFRGREMMHNEIGLSVVNRFAERTQDLAKIEKPAKIEGRQIFLVLSPLAQVQ
jgi:translation initiation factor IF-3